MPDDLDSGTTEHVVLLIGQSLRWGDNNGVSSMCTERVEVLHVATDDGVLEFVVGTN
jgi:hypothetical protein